MGDLLQREMCACLVCLEAQKYLGTLSFWLTNTFDLLWFSEKTGTGCYLLEQTGKMQIARALLAQSTLRLSAYKEEQPYNECGH